jgi:speckle-type POZ protein
MIDTHAAFFDDMTFMLTNVEHSDVTFKIGSEEVIAHKCILSARCEFFRAMFRLGGMKESIQNAVDVNNHPLHAFKLAMKFIYTDFVDLSSCTVDESIDVIKLSEEYLLPRLKGLCEEAMTKNLETENACKMLAAAEQYGAKILRRNCLAFIKENMKAISESPNFAENVEQNPTIAMILFKEYAPIIEDGRRLKRAKTSSGKADADDVEADD